MAFIAIMAGKERAVLLQHDEIYDEEGWRMVVKIWKVPRSRNSPDGIDYSLSLISPKENGSWVTIITGRKDNHRHVMGEEGPYTYRGIDRLIADFRADVSALRRRGQ